MQIINKEVLEQIIEPGDLVVELDSDLECWVGGRIDSLVFPYPVISVQTGDIVNCYRSLEQIRRQCTLLVKNKDITLTY